MAVAYDARRATADVDAVFVPTSEVRSAVRRVAASLGLDEDWLGKPTLTVPSSDWGEHGFPTSPPTSVGFCTLLTRTHSEWIRISRYGECRF